MRVSAEYQGGRDYRVAVNGVDVTNYCYEADDKLGIAWCYGRCPDGRFIVVGDELMKVQLRGQVRIWRER